MFLVGAKIGNPGGKLAQAGDAGTSGWQLRGRHAAERLAHNPGGAPAEVSHEFGEIAAARGIESGLYGGSHNDSVIQNHTCITDAKI
jgi:hypothetical protein